jgi:hypothetical protein
MHGADPEQHRGERSDSDSGHADAAPAAGSCLGVPLEGTGNFGRSRRMPGCDVQRGPQRVWIGVDRCECAINLNVYACRRPVNDSSDLCVRNTLEVAEHQDGALDFRQPVVGGEDGTKLLGHMLHVISGSRIRPLGPLQKGPHGQFAQVCGGVDQRRPALARGNHDHTSQVGWIRTQRRAPAEQIRQLVGVHPPRLGVLF